MEGVCKIYEEHLKRLNPNTPSITYDISQLFDFIDQLTDLSCLVWVKHLFHSNFILLILFGILFWMHFLCLGTRRSVTLMLHTTKIGSKKRFTFYWGVKQQKHHESITFPHQFSFVYFLLFFILPQVEWHLIKYSHTEIHYWNLRMWHSINLIRLVYSSSSRDFKFLGVFYLLHFVIDCHGPNDFVNSQWQPWWLQIW